jgi:photosystem II stability/assembly factor-like uncharacterized protein
MKNILPIVLISLFSFTVISCSGEKDESTTAGSGTGDNTTGNNNDTTTTDTTTTDTTAPVLAEVSAVTTPNSSTTPGYTFSTTKSGTITYGGACSSSTTSATYYEFYGESVDVPIVFNTLTAEDVFNTNQIGLTTTGTYDNCTITVTDSDRNASLPLTVSKFQLYNMDYSCGTSLTNLDFKDTTSPENPYGTRTQGTFVGVGDTGGVVTSKDDGSTWLSLREGITGTPINTNYNFKAVTYGTQTHIYAGYGPDANGLIRKNGLSLYQGNSSSDTTFGDGGYNDNVTSPGGLDIDAAYYACGTFLMAGTVGSLNVILTSTDGATWDNSSRVNGAVNSIGMGNRAFIAVGDSGTTGYRSVDNGTTWTDVTLPSGGTYNGVTFGNNVFIAVAETSSSTAVVARSIDRGASWSNIDITSVGLYGVTFGNNIFVAVGDNGKIVRSTDNGSSWTAVTSPTSADLNAVAFAGGLSTFVAVGDNGTIVISADNGSSWSSKSANNTSTHLRAITF